MNNDFPAYSRGRTERCRRTRDRPTPDLSAERRGPPRVARDIVRTMSSTTHPIRAPTRGPTCDGYRFSKTRRDLQAVPNLRAFIPVLRNPLEVEVDGRPEDLGDPRAIVLLRLE